MLQEDENEILKLLYNYKKENKNDLPSHPYPLTNKNVIEVISKSIADIVYDAHEKKTLKCKQIGSTIGGLLYHWMKPSSHFPINDKNYKYFVQYFNKGPPRSVYLYKKYGEDFINELKESPLIVNKDDWENICNTINKKYSKSLETKLKANFIQTWYTNNFDQINFEYNTPNKNIQNSDVEKTVEYLKSLKNDPKVDDFIIIDDKKSVDDVENHQLNIKYAYGMLNMDKDEENLKFLSKVVKKVSEMKTEESATFIKYLWTNKDQLQLPSNIYAITLKNYQHLYEKPIINLAKDILEEFTTKSVNYEYEEIIKQSELEYILKICKTDLELINNIVFVLNKLLELSDFDVRLLKLINVVKKNYFDNVT